MNTDDFVKAFTEAMTHEGVEDMMKLWSPDGEYVHKAVVTDKWPASTNRPTPEAPILEPSA